MQQNENANRYASITFSLAFFIFLFLAVHVVFFSLDEIYEGHLLRIDLTRRRFAFSTFFLSLSRTALSLSFSLSFRFIFFPHSLTALLKGHYLLSNNIIVIIIIV